MFRLHAHTLRFAALPSQGFAVEVISAKLYPTPSQCRDLLRFLSVARWVYNRSLDQRIKAYRRRGESITLYQQQAMLTDWRAKMDRVRLVPARIERDALRRVDRGMKAFFRRVKAGEKPGFPRFKGSDRWRSFEVLQPGTYLRDGNRVHIPGIGPMKYRGMQQFDGKIKGIRVVRKASGWYVQLIVDTGPAPEKRPVTRRIGIDVGLTTFATLSNGEKIENPRWYRKAQKRLRFLQRRVSRRKKGSNRRRRAVQRVARFHERIADTRRDWTHKLTRRLVDEFDLIAVENLNVKGLARTRLAKSIIDAAWTEFAWQLDYKAENAGVQFMRVDPRNTTQDCSECGRRVPKTLRDREHVCTCGYRDCRDVNAAKNILRRASAEFTRGESVVVRAATCGRRASLSRELIFGEPTI